MPGSSLTPVSRRNFAKAAGAVAAGLVIVKPESVRGAPANSRLELGLIGAGGRGSHDAGVFISATNTQVVAVADTFQDRLERAKRLFDERHEDKDLPPVDPNRLYRGLSGYQDLLASGVDAVLVTSPPYFHPEHLAAAIDAGVNVYSEKPVATDVRGAKWVLESGRKAKKKNLSIEIGFQLRNSAAYAEGIERMNNGAIGDVVCGDVFYMAGALGDRSQQGESAAQTRLRNWVFDIALSGDIITEQNIHVLDMLNWHLGSLPIKVVGTGGQKARTGLGDCYDHFDLVYTYPGDIHISFTGAQFLKGYSGCAVRLYGSKGTLESNYGFAKITGENKWTADSNPFDQVEVKRVSNFVNGVLEGKPVNSARHAAESALTSIMGRIAAYTGKEMTWKKVMRSRQNFKVKLDVD